ncbi:uncharacterized protein RJT21DRAFT_118970 [Scheffersomyces amazonensis]|uniref:uncharacterized protein n=1 Tax=Scheffersomyces amazonensis TaxID=1078765 RepID=UPI00315C99D9
MSQNDNTTANEHNNPVTFKSLPIDIIENILKYVDISEIINIYTNHDLLHFSNNLRYALSNKILTSNLTYNNRVDYLSYLHMYKLTPIFEDKSQYVYLKTFTDFEELLNLNFNYKRSITISYYIWTLTDLVDLEENLKKLSENNYNRAYDYKFNLELEFDPDIEYKIDPIRLFTILNDFSNRVKLHSLIIYNFKQKYTLNIQNFIHLTRLWLDNCQISVNFAGEYRPGFDLKIDVNNKIKFKLQLSSISLESFENLRLAGSIELKLDSWKLYKCIKTLELSNLPSFVGITTDSIHGIPLPNSEELIIEDLPIQRVNLNESYIKSNSNLKRIGLTGIYMNPNISFFESKVENIKLTKSCPSLIYDIKYPPTLTELNLSNNKLKDLTFINDPILIPSTLKKLNLADNQLDWNSFIPNFLRFTNLKYLKLSNTNIQNNLINIKFPDSIETLSLEVNQIPSIEYVHFPLKLKDLGIGCNNIKLIKHHLLPSGLYVIHLTENYLSKVIRLDKNDRGEIMNLEVLYLNANEIKDIHHIKLPPHLKVLNLDSNNIERIIDKTFSSSIHELSIVGNKIEQFKQVSFGPNSKLKVLDLSLNSLTKFDLSILPKSILYLKLHSNQINFIKENSFDELKKIRYLDLSNNQLTSFEYTLPESLKQLKVNRNKINQFRIKFDSNSSPQISSISLYSNKIDQLSAKSLGSSDSTKLLKLVELDIYGNPLLNHHNVSDLILELIRNSINLSAMFAVLGREDQFYSRHSSNYFTFSVCSDKRIDEMDNDSDLSDQDSDDSSFY